MAVGAIVKKTIGTLGKSGANLGDALNIMGGVSDYKSAREQGNSKAVSVAKSVGTFAFYEAAGVWGLALSLGKAGIEVTKGINEHNTRTMGKAYESVGKVGSGYFNMSQAGYTMRQRSLNAIRSNGLNLQSTLGNEARMHAMNRS